MAHTKQELFVDDLERDNTNIPNTNNVIFENKLSCVSKGMPMYRAKYKHCHEAITGDIACNSYYKVDEDVKLLKELEVSISSIQ